MTTLFFVHGTGARDVSATVQQLRDGTKRVLGWEPDQVQAILWGEERGPTDRDITPALPPQYRTRSAGGLDDEPEDEVALWDVLLADPTAELRTVALQDPTELPVDADSGGGLIDPNAATPDQALQEGLHNLVVDQAVLDAAGVTTAQLTDAASQIADTGLVVDAAAHAGITDIHQLSEAVSRAVVATALRTVAASDHPDANALYDAAVRDALVTAVAQSLAPGQPRGIGDRAKRFVAGLGTRLAVQKRRDFMVPMSNFLRDISFYLQHGEKVRDYIAQQLRQHTAPGPVIVLGHSLGGIACVDLLADPAQMTGANPLRVDLLVTVGSQAPYLYLLDSLKLLSPNTPGSPAPFQPWLNIYNDEDLLSFCAKPVFDGFNAGIVDEAVDARVPFPMAHSAYWGVDRVYELVGKHL